MSGSMLLISHPVWGSRKGTRCSTTEGFFLNPLSTSRRGWWIVPFRRVFRVESLVPFLGPQAEVRHEGVRSRSYRLILRPDFTPLFC